MSRSTEMPNTPSDYILNIVDFYLNEWMDDEDLIHILTEYKNHVDMALGEKEDENGEKKEKRILEITLSEKTEKIFDKVAEAQAMISKVKH